MSTRLQDAGELDEVGDRQPQTPPELTAELVGRKLEVCWRYHENGKPVMIWCTGVVDHVADGKSDKKSDRCKNILPAGMIRMRWPEDKERHEKESFTWNVLHPAKWNKDTHLGWRWDASEL